MANDEGYEERLARLKERPGYILLGRTKESNNYVGYVEHSFSMGRSPDETVFFFSGTAYSNFGTKHELDGKRAAEHHKQDMLHDSVQWEVWDVHDPQLPVVLDYERMAAASEPAKTMSGVKDKYGARNFKFKMKGDEDAPERTGAVAGLPEA